MDPENLLGKASDYLHTLCVEIKDRRVGSVGNRAATNFAAGILNSLGLVVEQPMFECLDWQEQGATLVWGDQFYMAKPSPYSLGCSLKAPLVHADTVEALEEVNTANRILLLSGEITREQLMPRQFPFYNPEHHQRVYRLLEQKAPLAILTATSRNPELAGGMYPFPMIEDGDFDIPSAYLKDVEGERLLEAVGQEVELEINARRIPSTGHNVIARSGRTDRHRIVVCAHIDAKDDTPGALDNASGVVMMLLLAEMLADYTGPYAIEFVAFNGEDHYSAQGQKHYIQDNQGHFDEILLAINTDVAGYIHGRSVYSLYGCNPRMEAVIRASMTLFNSLEEGEAWYQSDHSIFIQQGCPAMAITSDQFMWLSSEVTHTPKDQPALVDPRKVVEIALALRELLLRLDTNPDELSN